MTSTVARANPVDYTTPEARPRGSRVVLLAVLVSAAIAALLWASSLPGGLLGVPTG